MAKIHLIHGFMGFGKTTLAKKLEKELPAIRFTHDEFMRKLYARHMPSEEFKIAYNKIDKLIWELAQRAIDANVDVILDYGFWSKKGRKAAYDRAKKITNDVLFHVITCDIEVAKSRVLNRTNTNEEELFIDENCFNEYLSLYEKVSLEEGFEFITYSQE